jgi:hypothetical protein
MERKRFRPQFNGDPFSFQDEWVDTRYCRKRYKEGKGTLESYKKDLESLWSKVVKHHEKYNAGDKSGNRMKSMSQAESAFGRKLQSIKRTGGKVKISKSGHLMIDGKTVAKRGGHKVGGKKNLKAGGIYEMYKVSGKRYRHAGKPSQKKGDDRYRGDAKAAAHRKSRTAYQKDYRARIKAGTHTPKKRKKKK